MPGSGGLPAWLSGKRICLPVQEAWVLSLGWEDPLEESMATHSSILAWRIPMDRGAWQATVYGVTEFDMTEQLSTQKPFQIFKNLFLIGG